MSAAEAEPHEAQAGRLGRRLDPDTLGTHVERLYRAAYGLCGSRQDAEDLVQDTYERVLRRPRFVRRDDDLAYLLRVLRNTWVSSRRTGRGVTIAPAGDAIEEVGGAHDPIAQRIEGAAVFEALRELTDPLREALVAVDAMSTPTHSGPGRHPARSRTTRPCDPYTRSWSRRSSPRSSDTAPARR